MKIIPSEWKNHDCLSPRKQSSRLAVFEARESASRVLPPGAAAVSGVPDAEVTWIRDIRRANQSR